MAGILSAEAAAAFEELLRRKFVLLNSKTGRRIAATRNPLQIDRIE